MQTMSTDPQSYYPNAQAASHQQPNPYFIHGNGIETQYPMTMNNPNSYGAQRLNPQFINPTMPNGYQTQYYQSVPFMPPFVSAPAPRANAQFYPIIRPSNEQMNPTQNYIPSTSYSVYPGTSPNISSTTPVFQQQYYPNNYSTPQGFLPVQSTQMPNQPMPPPGAPYSMPQNIPPHPKSHQTPTAQPPPIDQTHGQISSSNTTQNISQVNPHGNTSQHEKRQKKPLAIVDPVSHKTVELSATASSIPANPTSLSTTIHVENSHQESTTDSTPLNPKSENDTNRTQKQADFRRQFAEILVDSANTQTDKNLHQSPTPDDPPGAAPTKQHSHKQSETLTQQSASSASSSRSGSISRPKSPTPTPKTNEQPQPGCPGILTRTITDDKINLKNPEDPVVTNDRIDSQKQQQESEPIELTDKCFDDSKTTSDDEITKAENENVSNCSESQSTATIECVTTLTTTTNNDKSELSATPNQRLRYDRQELLRIRDNSSAFPIPQLPDLDIIINRRDHVRYSCPNYTGTISQGRLNPQYHRQLSGSNHPSLTRHPNSQHGSSSDSRRKQAIYLSNEIEFSNRVENPYKPIEQGKLDTNNKVLRDVKSILNKVTPQTFEKLQKQLESLEIDRYERLEGMINIFFSKAVDEPAFSFLYAKLCKQFQKKQVTVPSEDGKTVTHYFRQILLTRCQKEFESDYRQEIEYEKRKNDVESITDEKKHKEEAEKLDEDLVKAKRRKLGNIFFIGELFKLQMLTDTIMYDCVDYLLREKTDEEGLECLCRLLRTIGKELDVKSKEKRVNKENLEKHYLELENIVKEHKTSARIRFMIQDLLELRQASWVARRVEAKPTTIDEIHEEERQKREQQEREQERERQQRRDQNRTVIGTAYSGVGQQQYNDGRGSRGSGIKQQTSRNDDDRTENRFTVNSVRQLQSNDKRNQGPLAMSLAPQRTWAKGSGIEKKSEDDRSFAGRASKPPAGPVQQLKGKIGSSQSGSLQRQSSRELARENSQRDRENALQSLRKTTTGSGVNSPVHTAGSSSMANSREGSRNVSREQSRNASRESSVSERTSNVSLSAQISKSSTNDTPTVINEVKFNATFDEEKTQARVHSLIEEYTENYSESTERPVKEALEDLVAFSTSNYDQQAIIVRELFTNVLEAKSRARKAVGHLLDAALSVEIISSDAFLSGFKMIVDATPDYAVDIPLIWQYLGEILGAFIGAPTSNMSQLKSILQIVPDDKSKQLFQYIIRFAVEFSSRSRIQKFWKTSGFNLNDVIKSDFIDSTFTKEFDWLFDTLESEPSTPAKENSFPRADQQLVKLFKSVSDQGTTVTDPEIITYIRENMNSNEKFYIRNIVLSYLEACLINRDPQKKIQEDIAKKRMTILNAIIEHKPEAEIQAVYAIQNFVSKLEHPPKMARLLFDIFYDEECVSEDAFFEWLKHPDQSETEGHSVVEMSTKDFFTWLQQAETEVEEGEEEEGGN